jgi:hypothetical protein
MRFAVVFALILACLIAAPTARATQLGLEHLVGGHYLPTNAAKPEPTPTPAPTARPILLPPSKFGYAKKLLLEGKTLTVKVQVPVKGPETKLGECGAELMPADKMKVPLRFDTCEIERVSMKVAQLTLTNTFEKSTQLRNYTIGKVTWAEDDVKYAGVADLPETIRVLGTAQLKPLTVTGINVTAPSQLGFDEAIRVTLQGTTPNDLVGAIILFRIDQGDGWETAALPAIQGLQDDATSAWLEASYTRGAGTFIFELSFKVPAAWANVTRFEITDVIFLNKALQQERYTIEEDYVAGRIVGN